MYFTSILTGDHGYGVHVLGPFVGRTVRLDAALIEETWILKDLKAVLNLFDLGSCEYGLI